MLSCGFKYSVFFKKHGDLWQKFWWKRHFAASIPNIQELFKSLVPFLKLSDFMNHFPGISEWLNSGFIREKYWVYFFPSSNPLYLKGAFTHVVLLLSGNTV